MASAVDYGKHGDSLSLDGKVDEHGIQQEVVNPLVDIPDPDAGLSEEERAAAVCVQAQVQSRAALLTALRTRSSFASSTSNSSHGCPSSTLSVSLPFADAR